MARYAGWVTKPEIEEKGSLVASCSLGKRLMALLRCPIASNRARGSSEEPPFEGIAKEIDTWGAPRPWWISVKASGKCNFKLSRE